MKAWKIEPCKCREGAGHVAGCPNRFGEIGNAIAEFIEDDKRLIAAGAVRNDPSTWRPDLNRLDLSPQDLP